MRSVNAYKSEGVGTLWPPPEVAIDMRWILPAHSSQKKCSTNHRTPDTHLLVDYCNDQYGHLILKRTINELSWPKVYLSPSRKKGPWQQGQWVVDLDSCRLGIILLSLTCEQIDHTQGKRSEKRGRWVPIGKKRENKNMGSSVVSDGSAVSISSCSTSHEFSGPPFNHVLHVILNLPKSVFSCNQNILD